MSRVVIVVNDPNMSIEQLNEKLQMASPEAPRTINALIDYLAGAMIGNVVAGSVQVTTRGTDPSVGTNGTSSTQISVDVG